MELKLFYSWQIDTEAKFNRTFIEESIKAAIKTIKTEKSLVYKIVLDKDIKGRTGSPDIANEIFTKIINSHIFIADISIINSKSRNKKFTPNPNVLTELGFAAAKLGWENTILICNEAYRKREDIPFDLRNRKIIGYSLKNLEQKKVTKNILAQQIQYSIISIANNPEIFNKHFITQFFAYINNKLFDLEYELLGFVNTVYKYLNVEKPEETTITEFQNLCKGINAKAQVISSTYGSTYLKNYANWYEYIQDMIVACQDNIKGILIFAIHLDIAFLGLFGQIDTILNRIIKTLHIYKNNADLSSFGFQIFSAIEFQMAASDYFSSKYGALSKVAMDNYRTTRGKYSKVRIARVPI